MTFKKSHIPIACQQIIAADDSVFSIQWIDVHTSIAGHISPEQLLQRYLHYIRQFTFGVIRPSLSDGGLDFCLGSSRFAIISFLAPENMAEFTTIRICGGFLVQPHQCKRGELRFGVEKQADTVRISLKLSDYCPLILGGTSPSQLRIWLYRLTQAALHKLVTIRFLTLIYKDITGESPLFKTVHVAVQNGKPV